uniref:Uncharacterized protein n=1 Tax=Tanacetum cinerariifolium TaxID=118510 RepID=A0A6L2KPN2_TANCI|nr:hypothetical protein [Tanacetum cinerariifolium]
MDYETTYAIPKHKKSVPTQSRMDRLLEFVDDTITDYSRPSSTIESNSDDLQNRDSSVTKTGESSSTISSKLVIKFVKAADRPTEMKTNKVETIKKSAVKYVELYRKTSKSANVRGNQRNWNNLKSQQLESQEVRKGVKSKNSTHKNSQGTKRSRGSKSKEVVDYILQVKIKLLIKKLKDSEAKHQV